MKKTSKKQGAGATLPPFERFPFRSPESAVYRTDAPPRGKGNPCYEALPTPWSAGDVWRFITTGNPTYDPTVRELSVGLRKERVDEVLPAMFPMGRQLRLEEMLSSTIRNSYVGRNPADSLYMEHAVDSCNRGFSTTFDDEPVGSGTTTGVVPVGPIITTGAGPVGSGCVLGPPGTGKSESIKHLLPHCYPQVILHSKYRGGKLGIEQLAWVYLSCPPKASVSGLIEWIAAVLDYIFHTDALAEVVRAKSDTARARIIARRLALQVTGMVVLDELQNVHCGNLKDRLIFSNFLQELINTTRTRFVFVGTPSSINAVCGEAMSRRLVGERGVITWGQLDYETEWPNYIEHLWQWQATKCPTVLNEETSHCMFQLTGGNPNRASQLFVQAQMMVIGNPHHPREIITPEVLKFTMKECFSEAYRQVQKEIRRTELLNKVRPKSNFVPPDQKNSQPLAPPQQLPLPPLPVGSANSGFNLNEIIS